VSAQASKPEGLTVVAGGRAPTQPVAAKPAAAPAGAAAAPAARRATVVPGSFLRPAATVQGAAATALAAEPEMLETPAPGVILAPVALVEAEQAAEAPAPVVAPRRAQQASAGFGQLFRKVTGGASGLMKRNLGEAAAPAAPPPAPRVETIPEAPRAPRQTQQEDIGLDIPAFLRRQAN